ncbi:hypothetical protein ACH5RR_041353 [Cinchona calisaya]|uniref:KIB1-4 beta-propeller domain-containing protein n=1 Tax=Cinchona calisaya TaxID=153742 RepID=A0ABD2XTG9_9GENT
MLELIAQHLTKIEDYVAFGAVCTSWRAAAAAFKNNFKGLKLWQQIPCLMLSSEDDDREFYSLIEQEVVAKVVTRDCFANYGDRQGGELDRPTYDTKGFQVYEVDLLGGKWKEINHLGNRALFLGHSASISLDVSTNKLSPRIKQNHIYFTDDCWQGYLVPNGSDIPEGGGGKDMGVCNLETGIIELFYNVPQRISLFPSIWITPNL